MSVWDEFKRMESSRYPILPETHIQEYLNYALEYNLSVDTVKFLIENKADVTYQNSYSVTLCKDLEVMKLLVEHKADITEHNNLALLNVCGTKLFVKTLTQSPWYFPDINLVKYLVSLKADIKTENSQCVINARYFPDIVKYLVENNADLGSENITPLIKSIEQGNLELTRFFLKENPNLEIFYSITLAAEFGHLEIIKLLLEFNADINEGDNSPFTQAVHYGHLDCIKYMINEGYVNITDEKLMNKIFDDRHTCIKGLIELFERGLKPKVKSTSYTVWLYFRFYRKWRKIVLKKFIRRVILPLYYSPGFSGNEKEKINFQTFLASIVI